MLVWHRTQQEWLVKVPVTQTPLYGAVEVWESGRGPIHVALGVSTVKNGRFWYYRYMRIVT